MHLIKLTAFSRPSGRVRLGWLLLFCLCLLPIAGRAAVTESEAESFYQAEILALQKDAGAWTKRLLPQLPPPEITCTGDEAAFKVIVPSIKAGPGEGSTGMERLRSLLQPFLFPGEGQPITLTAVRSSASGQLTWKKSAGIQVLSAAVKKAAAAGKKTYGKLADRVVQEALFPAFAQMPKKRPESPVPFSPHTWYGDVMGKAFGLSAEEANERFPYLAMLVKVAGVDLADSPYAALVKLKVRNWAFMVEHALPIAKSKVEGLMGAKDQPRSVYAELLGEALSETFLRVYYGTKKPEGVDLTVNLVDVAEKGVEASQPLVQWLSAYNQAVENTLDQLMAYGETLPYYPRVPLMDAGILSGSDDSEGARVTFRTPMADALHGYVKIQRDGKTLLTGFIRKGVRLMVKLLPGTYDVFCGLGEDWFGPSIVFGKEAVYGKFSLTIGDDKAYDVLLSAAEGGMDQASFEDVVEAP